MISNLPIVFLAGGGSGGAVAPLLAVAMEFTKFAKSKPVKFILFGTKSGPEQQMASQRNIPFVILPSAKLHRFVSWKNFILPFLFICSFIKALYYCSKYKPAVIFGAGGFTEVPLILAGKFFGAKVLLHQQDVRLSLSNLLCSKLARRITVTWPDSLSQFTDSWLISGLTQESKVVITGNPCMLKSRLPLKSEALKEFGLSGELPVLLVFGGGTGALGLNNLIVQALPELTKFIQVLHVTGAGRAVPVSSSNSNYFPFEFIPNMSGAYAVADVVLARCGMSTITELSQFGKVSILIPMPGSHQEDNAEILSLNKASIVLDQSKLDPMVLAKLIRRLGFSLNTQNLLSINIKSLLPQNAASRVAKELISLL